jgi:hypothetical protein
VFDRPPISRGTTIEIQKLSNENAIGQNNNPTWKAENKALMLCVTLERYWLDDHPNMHLKIPTNTKKGAPRTKRTPWSKVFKPRNMFDQPSQGGRKLREN